MIKFRPKLLRFKMALWPQNLAWQNFQRATLTFPFLPYLGNTVFYAVLTMVGSLLSNFVIAYGFSRIKWRGAICCFIR